MNIWMALYFYPAPPLFSNTVRSWVMGRLREEHHNLQILNQCYSSICLLFSFLHPWFCVLVSAANSQEWKILHRSHSSLEINKDCSFWLKKTHNLVKNKEGLVEDFKNLEIGDNFHSLQDACQSLCCYSEGLRLVLSWMATSWKYFLNPQSFFFLIF